MNPAPTRKTDHVVRHSCPRDANDTRMDQTEIVTCIENLEAGVNNGGFHLKKFAA
jgi:hypothetical protein